MGYAAYGRSGEAISRLAFGGMRFAEPQDVEAMAEVVLAAYDQGINYFDTAPGYCQDLSEQIIGRAVRQMQRQGGPRFYLSSKSSKADGAALRADLERSLERLGVDAIDFYHCWYLLSLEGWEERKRGGAVDALLRAREEGLIRHLAFSTHLAGDEIGKILEEKIFEGVTLGYNAINFPYRREAVTAAGEAGLGVVVMNPLGGGTIPQNPESFSFIRTRAEQSMLEAALGFLWSHREVTAALVGFRSVEDVLSAAAAWRAFDADRDSIDLERLEAQIERSFDKLCTACRYCRDCPQEIPVYKYLESWNHLKLKGGESLWERLKWHYGIDDLAELERCTACGSCEQACPQRLPILERFEELKRSYVRPE